MTDPGLPNLPEDWTTGDTFRARDINDMSERINDVEDASVSDAAGLAALQTIVTALSSDNADDVEPADLAAAVATLNAAIAGKADKQTLYNLIHVVRVVAMPANVYTVAAGSVTLINGLVIDGITVAVGDKILIRDAPSATGVGVTTSNTAANGLYAVTSLAGGNIAVARSAELSGAVTPQGHLFRILEGTYGNITSGYVGRIFGVTSPTASGAAFTWGTTALQIGDSIIGGAGVSDLIRYFGGAGRSTRGAALASAATYSINVDSYDYVRLLTQAVNVTNIAIAGSPFNGHLLTLEWADTGTARTIVHGTLFANGTAPMATTTIVGQTIRETFRFNGLISKYECVECTVESTPRVKVTEYTNPSATALVSGTGVCPAGAVGVRVKIIPGGSPGASGRRGAAGTNRGGGGGGANQSGVQDYFLPITQATYSYVLGHVGAGGLAVTTDDTNGNAGTNMDPCSFQMGTARVGTSSTSLVSGNGGTTAGGTSGSTVIRDPNTSAVALFLSGGPGGVGVGGDGMDTWSPMFPSGAGGGGGISVANVASAGGSGGRNRQYAVAGLAAGGVVDGAVPAVPDNANVAGLPGQGGGGGAASITQAAQGGADGVGYGAPGGGGGASLNGFASGRGGNGGPAYMRLEWVYA